MASSKNSIKQAVKQLRSLVSNLDKGKKATPLLMSLLASLTRSQSVIFNKVVICKPFNKTIQVRGVGFNKKIVVKSNLAKLLVKFNKTVAAMPFNKRAV